MDYIKLLKLWGNGLIELLFPEKCGICKNVILPDSQLGVCGGCFTQINFLNEGTCKKCGKKIAKSHFGLCIDCRKMDRYFDEALSVVEYKGEITRALKQYKFRNKKCIKSMLIKLLLTKKDVFLDKSIDYILSVPQHKNRMKSREYDHTHLLAKEFAKELNIEYLYNEMIKRKSTKSQVSLGRNKRLENLEGAFKIKNPILFKDKKILIIDDIYTTGATLNECAKTLKAAGADKVYGLTVASGIGY